MFAGLQGVLCKKKEHMQPQAIPRPLAMMSEDEFFQRLEAVIEAKISHMQPSVPSDPLPEFLTRKEAAAFLKCAPASVDNWTRSGLLRKHYVGGRTPRFHRDELRNFFKK